MASCLVRLDPALRGFLRPALRGEPVTVPLDGLVPVMDRIQALGVPHTEVGRIEVAAAGRTAVAVSPDHRLADGEAVDVHPVAVPQAWPEAAEDAPGFVLDGHLGRLAGYLRLLGFDVEHATNAEDGDLAAVAAAGTRVLLSRDVGLLKRSAVRHGAFVYATDPLAQLREIHDRFGLDGHARPLTRCRVCNSALLDGAGAGRAGDVPADVVARGLPLHHCPHCGRSYWPGGHRDRLRARFAAAGITLG
ncbi:Mut7-C RNAse domain-containing protein [Tersicoccus sp. Bi-70]|uniref:Mut7-C RNAse domain-containing protein n=1 Tax=Tersicoccus sp. Bi-70 TaxID=1897634 RepID=UPI0009786AC6|nr:Mut7-C RNAse domain-containing protein [Tersicoccus sp. Bi-70]OMH32424.1 hypothetical protein BGP79_08430 [Tersicoccus sp. Bi-70]